MIKDFKNNKKPTILFYIAVIIGLFILNMFIFPGFRQDKIVEVTYDQFIEHTQENKIKEAEILDGETKYKLRGDDETIYKVKNFELGVDRDLITRLFENKVQFKRVSQQLNPILMLVLNTLVSVIFFIILWQILGRVIKKSMGDVGPMSFGKNNAKIYVKPTDGITFADVAGQEEAKDMLKEIVDFLHQPAKYAEIGARLPKGALLVGPPGTGKTLLAQAIAGEANVPFFSISGSEFVEMFVGLGASKVRDLFKQANEKAPCIVFIDEIDTIGKKRDSAGFSSNDEREQTLNQLLSEMDGFESNKGVVILGATNRPESLDPALLRPGRFDRRIPVELPDLAGREAILLVHIRKVRHDPAIDLNMIARATAGASGADLANMVNEAALRAVRCGRDKVIDEDILESVDIVLAGYEKKNAVINQDEKKIIAYHEVGHAIVAAAQTNTAPVHKITIVPRTSGALGFTMQVDEEEKYLYSKEDAFSKIAILTGGRAAEELIFNSQTSGASNDIEKATKLARAMITRFGMNEKIGFVAVESVRNPYLGGDSQLMCSDETASLVDEEVRTLIESAHENAINILKENIDKLHEIAAFLLQKETITGEEFMEIFRR
ncbi:MAG: ATP-dependent zinc metalloprotease FtsH [Tissierellia bacterium]|nr:ATP-dependent zinc metalloprotease FtsH [Tissierellia bacterium]